MMMSQSKAQKLSAEKRQVFGRKVKRLRSQGLLPANIYGKGLESVAIQISQKQFSDMYASVGETGIVTLNVDSDKPKPVLINQVDYDPITGNIDHVDFRQVDLKVKITTNVPIELTGESPSVKEHNAVIVQTLEEIEVEALPTEIPDAIVIDIAELKEIGDSISVSDLKVPSGVEITSDPETPVVAAQEVKEEVEEPAEPIETEVIGKGSDKDDEAEASDSEKSGSSDEKSEENKN